MRVLVVDARTDDDRGLLLDQLGTLGHTTADVRNMADAVTVLSDSKFDVLIADTERQSPTDGIELGSFFGCMSRHAVERFEGRPAFVRLDPQYLIRLRREGHNPSHASFWSQAAWQTIRITRAPIIVLSGDDVIREFARECGHVGLAKPYKLDQLQWAVEFAVEQYRRAVGLFS